MMLAIVLISGVVLVVVAVVRIRAEVVSMVMAIVVSKNFSSISCSKSDALVKRPGLRN